MILLFTILAWGHVKKIWLERHFLMLCQTRALKVDMDSPGTSTQCTLKMQRAAQSLGLLKPLTSSCDPLS